MEDLARFPAAVRRKAGYQIFRVQQGDDPADWKPMNAIGPGVREIRIRDAGGTFRVIYVARFAGAIYVLHCFEKKTRKTRVEDVDLARRRYSELVRELSQ